MTAIPSAAIEAGEDTLRDMTPDVEWASNYPTAVTRAMLGSALPILRAEWEQEAETIECPHQTSWTRPLDCPRCGGSGVLHILRPDPPGR